MSTFWKRFLIGSLIFVLASGGYIYFKFFIPADIALNTIEVQGLNGKQIALQDKIGKPMVVNFWATWCGPCLKEFPDFEKVKQQYGDKVNFVMISDEPLEKIKKFAKSKPYTFTFLKTNKTLNEYGITFIPTSYFYDTNGNLIAKDSNGFNVDSLTAMIEKLH